MQRNKIFLCNMSNDKWFWKWPLSWKLWFFHRQAGIKSTYIIFLNIKWSITGNLFARSIVFFFLKYYTWFVWDTLLHVNSNHWLVVQNFVCIFMTSTVCWYTYRICSYITQNYWTVLQDSLITNGIYFIKLMLHELGLQIKSRPM